MGVIGVVIILSVTFTLRVDTTDKELNQERIEFSEILTQKFNGRILSHGDVLRLLSYTQLQASPDLFKEFKTSTYDFSIRPRSNFSDYENMMVHIKLYAQSLDELIQIGKEHDLKYIAINESAKTGKEAWYPYLSNIYDEEENYPFLTKVLDTEKMGFKKFKVKVFEINYDKFILNET